MSLKTTFQNLFWILCFGIVCQTVSASGLGSSGGLQVPDPETLPVGEYQFSLYYEMFEETSVNTGNLSNTGDITFVANAGIYDLSLIHI